MVPKAEEHSPVLGDLGLKKEHYILATVHRAENTDAPARLLVIMRALAELAAEFPVVSPIRPRTPKQLADNGLAAELGKLHLTDPLGYLDMMMLEKNARLIAADSGGVQPKLSDNSDSRPVGGAGDVWWFDHVLS